MGRILERTHPAVAVEAKDPAVTGQSLPRTRKRNPVQPIQEISSSLSSLSASSSLRLQEKAVAALTNRGYSVLPLKRQCNPGEVYDVTSKTVAAMPIASPITVLSTASTTITTSTTRSLREEPSISPYRPYTRQPAWLWTTAATFEDCFQSLLQKDEKFCQFDGVNRGWAGTEI